MFLDAFADSIILISRLLDGVRNFLFSFLFYLPPQPIIRRRKKRMANRP